MERVGTVDCSETGLASDRVPAMFRCMEPSSILFIVLAALIGIAIGWFVASRPIAEWKARHAAAEGETRAAEEKLARMVPELATMSERAARADALAAQLDDARAQNARFAAERAGFEEQKRLLEESRVNLLKEFENAGAKVLAAAQDKLLATAAERLGHSEKASEEKLRALLQPVGDRLARYEQQVEALEAKRVDAFGQLTGLIEAMKAGQEEVRREAQRLGNSLRNAPKTRGRWGEQALKNVLEQCGLGHHTDFITEHSVEGSSGRMRPDAIVRVPGNKLLVIDAKVSLNDYQDAFEADNDDDRNRALDRHLTSMKSHIQTLGTKDYQSQFDEAPDFVVMFVPGEHFINAAIEHDAKRRTGLGEEAILTAQDLWNYAFERRVILASPTNLVAIARTVAQVWRQDTIAKEAAEIGRMGAELYGRLDTAAQHLKRVGGGLETAVNNYNKFVGSFERNVLTSGRRLADKGIEIGKREIEAVPLVESAPRYTAGDAAAIEDGREAAE